MVTNMKNTIHGFKRLLGRNMNDPQVQEELKTLPYRVSPHLNDQIGIKVLLFNIIIDIKYVLANGNLLLGACMSNLLYLIFFNK